MSKTVMMCLAGGILALATIPVSAQPSAEYLTEKEPTRHALVIGNANYLHLPKIASASADADRMERTLVSAGFRVHKAVASSLRDFEDAVLPVFRKEVNPGDVVIVFFSGHGFSEGAHNYIAPLDLPIELAHGDLPRNAISLETLEYYFSSREPGLLLFLVDACRSLTNFKVRPASGSAGDSAVLKGSERPPAPLLGGVNFMIGFAARPGSQAIGWNSNAKASPFTAGLLAHIANEGIAFKQAFIEASADVQEETQEAQQPGLIDYSLADLWVRPSLQILSDQTEAWLAVLATGDPSLVRRFLRRHTTSRYAHAARRWLDRSPPSLAQGTSLVAPVAVEQAWHTPVATKTVTLASSTVAFSRQQSAAAPSTMSAAQQQRILDSSQGGIGAPEVAKPMQRDIDLFRTYGGAVTTSPHEVHISPSIRASSRGILPAGTPLMIVAAIDLGATNKWYEARLPDDASPIFLKATQPRQAYFSLGMPLLEIEAPPKATGLSDLVEVAEIDSAIARLTASGHKVRWVSLATGHSVDELESDARLARLAHATYVLRVRGIDPSRLTSVADAGDMKGGGVRIRFFGDL